MNIGLLQILLVIGLLGGMSLALEIGFRIGRRAARKGGDADSAQLGAIQGAMLGLVGLFLGFSFSGAASRFLDRAQLIVQEANAIGTAYLRADLLNDPHRSTLRQSLQAYTRHRIDSADDLALRNDRAAIGETERLHGVIWSAARAGVLLQPEFGEVVLPPVNDVIDHFAEWQAARRRHLPPLVVALLVASSAMALFAIGVGHGQGGKRHAAITGTLAVLLAATLWTTIDLDYPRIGVIRISDAPLRELHFDAVP